MIAHWWSSAEEGQYIETTTTSGPLGLDTLIPRLTFDVLRTALNRRVWTGDTARCLTEE